MKDKLSWEMLKKALIAWYRGGILENPFEELLMSRQTGSAEEFVESFELLSTQVGRLLENGTYAIYKWVKTSYSKEV